MAANGSQFKLTLRLGRREYKRLAWAFAISLAVHVLFYGGYQFTRTVLPVWLERVRLFQALAQELRKKPTPPPQPTEVPLVFVQVNPAVATPEAPKDAKYYSSQNSKAANPDAKADSNDPKISGTQEHVPKTENVPRTANKLQPSAGKSKQTEPEQVAKPKPVVGDLAMAKPDMMLRPDKGEAETNRPRTLAEAKMRQHSDLMPGQEMKQEGGVRRHLEISSLDAKATPFGAYDAAFIAAVQQRWYDLLDSMNFSFDRHGRVVLQFHLNYDGTITDMQVVDDTVDGSMDGIMGILCQRAVRDPAPYERWPREMRLQTDKDYREIQFSFFYD